MKKKSDTAGCRLAEKFVFANISVLKEDVSNLLDNDASQYEIDLSAIKSIDVAGLQLLMALAGNVEDRQASITWKNAPDVVVKGVEALNLDKHIRL